MVGGDTGACRCRPNRACSFVVVARLLLLPLPLPLLLYCRTDPADSASQPGGVSTISKHNNTISEMDLNNTIVAVAVAVVLAVDVDVAD